MKALFLLVSITCMSLTGGCANSPTLNQIDPYYAHCPFGGPVSTLPGMMNTPGSMECSKR